MIIQQVRIILVVLLLSNISIGEAQSKSSLIGVYFFKNEFDTNITRVNRMEKWLGGGTSLSKNAVLHFFTQWCPALSTSLDWYTTSTIRDHLNKFWASGSIPLMTWQPVCYDPSLLTLSTLSTSTKTPDNFVKLIGDGTYDSYIIKVATEYKTFLAGPDGIYGNADDRRAYIRLGHEMNGNWYQWSVAKNPFITTADYKNMWVHVRQVFDALLSTSVINGFTVFVDSSTRLQWIWCPNNFDTGGISAESYYPGDPYVDWLGFDVYNQGGGSPKASYLMTPMIGRMQLLSPTKPISIPEYGTDYVATQGITPKSVWLDDFFNQTSKYGISMIIQFNSYLNAVYDSGDVNIPDIPEFVNIVKRASSWINNGDQTLPRLVTDAAFKGYIPKYISPTAVPTKKPTSTPFTPTTTVVITTITPTYAPTRPPTATPSYIPSTVPIAALSSFTPSSVPISTIVPSKVPSKVPSQVPSISTIIPSKAPTRVPSNAPVSSGTVTSPLLPSYSYLGCYGDGNIRALENFLGNTASIMACYTLASAAGYQYFGLQYGGECRASNYYANAIQYNLCGPTCTGKTTYCVCTMKCTNGIDDCGGAYSNALYQINSSAGGSVAVTTTVVPSNTPSKVPTVLPTRLPSFVPSRASSVAPSTLPITATPIASIVITTTTIPSAIPSIAPTRMPSRVPSVNPTRTPTTTPVITATVGPSKVPSAAPVIAAVTSTITPSVKVTTTPSAAPNALKCTYLGCYGDNLNKRALEIKFASVASIAACYTLASAAGYQYFGLQYGGECRATNTYANAIQYNLCGPTCTGSNPNCVCTMKCTNGIDECGGGSSNALYQISAADSGAPAAALSSQQSSSSSTAMIAGVTTIVIVIFLAILIGCYFMYYRRLQSKAKGALKDMQSMMAATSVGGGRANTSHSHKKKKNVPVNTINMNRSNRSHLSDKRYEQMVEGLDWSSHDIIQSEGNDSAIPLSSKGNSRVNNNTNSNSSTSMSLSRRGASTGMSAGAYALRNDDNEGGDYDDEEVGISSNTNDNSSSLDDDDDDDDGIHMNKSNLNSSIKRKQPSINTSNTTASTANTSGEGGIFSFLWPSKTNINNDNTNNAPSAASSSNTRSRGFNSRSITHSNVTATTTGSTSPDRLQSHHQPQSQSFKWSDDNRDSSSTTSAPVTAGSGSSSGMFGRDTMNRGRDSSGSSGGGDGQGGLGDFTESAKHRSLIQRNRAYSHSNPLNMTTPSPSLIHPSTSTADNTTSTTGSSSMSNNVPKSLHPPRQPLAPLSPPPPPSSSSSAATVRPRSQSPVRKHIQMFEKNVQEKKKHDLEEL